MNTHESASSNTSKISSWLKATGGCVLMLLLVQFVTGTVMVFYYVPSTDHAHTTVSFIERALSSGSWLRSLHHYGSQWLALFVFLHLIRLHWFEAYKHTKLQWITTVLLLTLVMCAGATGYSLPWDARAFFSTRIAEGLLAGLPFVGRVARLWLLGGTDISTLTLSRFFALHVLIIPFAILILVVWRVIRQFDNFCWVSIFRNSVAAGVIFSLLSIWSLKFPAPLGPPVAEMSAEYLPRPGPQFLWLYETLKHLPGGLGSIVGVGLPGLLVLGLLFLPWLDRFPGKRPSKDPRRVISGVILGGITFWVITMTMTAYLSDWRDLRTRQQLAKQASDEKALRSMPFRPGSLDFGNGQGSVSQTGVPNSYVQFCATCHGPHGEGATQGQLRFPPLIGVAAKPRRTANDIIALLIDPMAYGLQPPMRSFATKLTEAEKREIAEWIVKLK